MNDRPDYTHKIVEIKDRLHGYITGQRLIHSFGVVDTAVRLALRYGCDPVKAEVAALLHDIARDIPLIKMKRLVEDERGIRPDDVVMENPLLLHAYAGKVIACKDFGINDGEILEAIELHTTGGASMGLLSRIVFIADYIEPSRNFRGVKKARMLAEKNLDSTLRYIYRSLLKHLLSQNRYICSNTLDGYNEIVLNVQG